MTVKNYADAFDYAVLLAKSQGHTGNFALDPDSEQRAGYKIYRDEEDYYTYICDLNDRLEYNSGTYSKNIWIQENMIDPQSESDTTIDRWVKAYKRDLITKDELATLVIDKFSK